MKKCLLILLLTIFCLSTSFGQDERIDSLRALLNKVNDTTRINSYNLLGELYKMTSLDSAAYFANAAIRESQEIEFESGQATGLRLLGAIKLDNGQFAESLDLLFQSLDLAIKVNDLYLIAGAYNDISVVYAMTEDFEKALEFFFKAFEMFEKIGNSVSSARIIGNIGLLYGDLGQDSMALVYLKKSLTMKENNGDTYGLAVDYSNLAFMMKETGYYDQALSYHLKSDSTFDLMDDKYLKIDNLIHTAKLFLLQGQVAQARLYALNAYELSVQFKFRIRKRDALLCIAEVEEERGDFESALKFYKEYHQLFDSLTSDEQASAMDKLKAKFELEEKNKQIEVLQNIQSLDQARSERQRIANYLLIISICFMVLVVVLLSWAYINNRKKNHALALANKEKDQFISILSHDIRGPLNSLKGFSSLLVEDPGSLTKEDLDFFSNKINHSIDRLLKLVNSILEWFFSKKSSDIMSLEKLDVAEQVEETMGLYSLMAYEKNIQLINETQPDTYCMADRNVLQTVLRNLLSNALKFSNHGGKITFTSGKQSAKRVIIEISDSGTGILKKDLPHLFEYSKKKVRIGTDLETGSGLGLPLSKELLENSSGSLEVESEPGVGSKFSIVLPKEM